MDPLIVRLAAVLAFTLAMLALNLKTQPGFLRLFSYLCMIGGFAASVVYLVLLLLVSPL